MEHKPNPIEDVRKLLARIDEEEMLSKKLLEAHKMGARIAFQHALHIQSFVSQPRREPEIANRFESLYRGKEIALAIMEAFDTNDVARLSTLADDIAENGGLIESKAPSEFAHRLSQPKRWVIAEAAGRHPDPFSPHHQEMVVCADCQCLLPDDGETAIPVVPQLDEQKDLIYDRVLYERIKKALPQSVGLIDQIAVQREFAHLRLAAEARHRAMLTVYDLEREYPIEHMIGLAFSLEGLEINKVKLLLENIRMKPISNMISLFVNERSKRCPATIVGRMRDCRVPVSFDYGGRHFDADFVRDCYYLDHQMDHVALPVTTLEAAG